MGQLKQLKRSDLSPEAQKVMRAVFSIPLILMVLVAPEASVRAEGNLEAGWRCRIQGVATRLGLRSHQTDIAQSYPVPNASEATLRPFVSGQAHVLDNALNAVRHTPLSEGIRNSGLNDSQLQLMQSHSRGFLSLRDYLRSDAVRGGYALGLGRLDSYPILADAKGLEQWGPAYTRLGIGTNEFRHTHRFLDHITSENTPVVMFVPNNVMTAKLDSVTKAEMDWLLAHPERLKNVFFVYGVYDVVPESVTQVFYQLSTAPRTRRRILERFIHRFQE